MDSFIGFILGNFTLTFFILGIIAALLALLKKSNRQTKNHIINTFFAYFLLFNIGLSYFYNFIMHVFFGQMAAEFIGWSQSPFQLEVGFASLGFAVVGIIAFFSNIGFRTACVIGPALFLWGAAGGHIYQMVIHHNFSPGNAGIIFWTDIIIPIISFWLLWLSYKNSIRDLYQP